MVLNAPDGHEVPVALLERAVRRTAAGEGVREGAFSVTFLADERIRALNRTWLEHDWVPDVLSFELHPPGEPPVGDIYVGIEQAGRQAVEEGVSLEEELVRLVVHGILHVLGHDHPEEGAEGSVMHGLQERRVREVLAGPEAGRDRAGSAESGGTAPPGGEEG